MNENFSKIFGTISDFFGGLTPQKRMAVLGIGGTISVFLIALFFWASDKTYEVLMTNLSPEDSSSIMKILREKNVPFRIDGGGKTIEIPPEYVNELRLELATMGLPDSSTVGYEVFDNQSLGTTSIVQGINQQRAKEGELMRTISTIKGVKRARVHLAIPKKSAFVEDQKDATASVFLDLHPGTVLDEKQVFGIGKLVSSAVEGLDISNVSIVDARGKVLSKNSRDPLVNLSASQHDFKKKIENQMESEVESILAKVVGEGRVVARVFADLDFSEVSEVQKNFDADGKAVISEQVDDTTLAGKRPAPMGAAGVKSNTPGQEGEQAPALVTNDTKKVKEVRNYRVPETVRQFRKEIGSIKKLSVAVIVDGQEKEVKDKDGVVQAKVEPWPPEQLDQFRSIVMSSLGLDQKRGDSIEIKNIEFKKEDFEKARQEALDHENRQYMKKLLMYGIMGAFIIMFFLLVVRPFMKWITENTIDSVDTFLPQTLEELERLQKNASVQALEESVPLMPERVDPEKVEGEMMREKIVTMIDGNPQKAALILREWVRSNAAKKKDQSTA